MREKEAVMGYGSIGTLVGAFLLALLNRYAPDMGGDLIESIAQIAAFAVPILISLWMARAQVYSANTVKTQYVPKEGDAK